MKYEHIGGGGGGLVNHFQGIGVFQKISEVKPSELEHRHMVISHSQAWNNVAQ